MRPGALGSAAIAGLGLAAYGRWLRDHQLTWGAEADEAAAVLPGDALVSPAQVQATRAITIGANPQRVWPWVAQMGQDRGGFYSYDAVENLVGCQVRSADHIEAAWQHPAVGDDFRLHPDVALSVALVDPAHAFAILGAAPKESADDAPAVPYEMTWAFVLRPHGADRTRLLVRERYRSTSGAGRVMLEPLTAVSFVMTHKMLRGIRTRAERG